MPFYPYTIIVQQLVPAIPQPGANVLIPWLVPLSEPVRVARDPRAAGALIDSGLFAPVLEPNSQIIQGFESRWHYPWSEPVRVKPRAADFPPFTFGFPPPQVFFPPNSWDDFARRAKPSADFPALAWSTFTPVGFTWFAPPAWPDSALRAKSVPDFIPWQFIEPPPQVFTPYDRWPERLLRAAPSPEFPAFTYGPNPAQVFYPFDRWPERLLLPQRVANFPFHVMGQAPFQVFYPFDRWPDSATKAKLPTSDFPTTVLGFPPPQVFYPWDRWPDLYLKPRPVVEYPPFTIGFNPQQVFYPFDRWPERLLRPAPTAQFPDLGWSTFTPAAAATFTWQPNNWTDPIQYRITQPVVHISYSFGVQTAQTVVVTDWLYPAAHWAQWTTGDNSYSFGATTNQTELPGRWPELLRRAPAVAEFPALAWSGFTPAAAATFTWQPNNWTDPVQNRIPWKVVHTSYGFGVQAIQTILPDRWPDLYLKPRPSPEFPQPVLGSPPPQVFRPYDRWPERLLRTPITEFPALAWSGFTPAAAAFTFPPGINWADPIQLSTPWRVVHIPYSFGVQSIQTVLYDRWPERLLRAAPSPEFPSFAYGAPPITAPFIWQQIGINPDFLLRARRTVEFPQPVLGFPPRQVWTPYDRWPDRLVRAVPSVEFPAFCIGYKPIQVFFPFDKWPDYIWKKAEPLKYEPLAPTFQPIRVLFSEWSQWPDFGRLLDKIGPHASKQPSLFFYPGIVPQATVTYSMLAFEIDTDGMIAAINVIPSTVPPNTGLSAADAIVGITETGRLV